MYQVYTGMSVLLILALSCSACGSTKLTRTKAAAIIQQYLVDNKITPRTTGLLIGNGISTFSLLSDNEAEYAKLADAGLVTVSKRDIPLKGARFGTATVLDVALTPKGQEYVHAIEPESEPDQQRATVRLSAFRIADVTGIQFLPGDRTAEVQFTWEYTEETPFSKAFGLDRFTAAWQQASGKTGAAAMQLFDDGWRVVKVRGTWLRTAG